MSAPLHNLRSETVLLMLAGTPTFGTLELARPEDGGGRWITLDGTHIYVKNGRVEKGPAALMGKSAKIHPVSSSQHGGHAPAGGVVHSTNGQPYKGGQHLPSTGEHAKPPHPLFSGKAEPATSQNRLFGSDAGSQAAARAAGKSSERYDADKAGTSKTGRGLFGQTTVDAATGTKQSEMFDTGAAKPASEAIKGSKSALDPANTSPLPFAEKGEEKKPPTREEISAAIARHRANGKDTAQAVAAARRELGIGNQPAPKAEKVAPVRAVAATPTPSEPPATPKRSAAAEQAARVVAKQKAENANLPHADAPKATEPPATPSDAGKAAAERASGVVANPSAHPDEYKRQLSKAFVDKVNAGESGYKAGSVRVGENGVLQQYLGKKDGWRTPSEFEPAWTQAAHDTGSMHPSNQQAHWEENTPEGQAHAATRRAADDATRAKGQAEEKAQGEAWDKWVAHHGGDHLKAADAYEAATGKDASHATPEEVGRLMGKSPTTPQDAGAQAATRAARLHAQADKQRKLAERSATPEYHRHVADAIDAQAKAVGEPAAPAKRPSEMTKQERYLAGIEHPAENLERQAHELAHGVASARYESNHPMHTPERQAQFRAAAETKAKQLEDVQSKLDAVKGKSLDDLYEPDGQGGWQAKAAGGPRDFNRERLAAEASHPAPDPATHNPAAEGDWPDIDPIQHAKDKATARALRRNGDKESIRQAAELEKNAGRISKPTVPAAPSAKPAAPSETAKVNQAVAEHKPSTGSRSGIDFDREFGSSPEGRKADTADIAKQLREGMGNKTTSTTLTPAQSEANALANHRAAAAKLSTPKLKQALQDHFQWNGNQPDAPNAVALREELTKRGVGIAHGLKGTAATPQDAGAQAAGRAVESSAVKAPHEMTSKQFYGKYGQQHTLIQGDNADTVKSLEANGFTKALTYLTHQPPHKEGTP